MARTGPGPGHRWPPARVLAVAVLLAYASWEATLGRFSLAARASVGAAIAATLAFALIQGRGRQHKQSVTWTRDGVAACWANFTGRGRGRAPAAVLTAVAAWVALALATIGWDLNSFAHEIHSLPTLSGLIGDVTRRAWGRGVVFTAWAALGAYLAAGWRRPIDAPGGARRDPDPSRPPRARAAGTPEQPSGGGSGREAGP